MRRRVAVAVVASAVGLAACGTSTAPSGALSAGGYRRAADAACQSERRAIVALGGKAQREHLDASEVVPLAEAINTRFSTTLQGLRPPFRLEPAHTRWLRDMAAEGSNRPVTVTGPAQTAALEARTRVRLRRVVADERELGLSICVRLAGKPAPRINA
jgi:hypothetical protein